MIKLWYIHTGEYDKTILKGNVNICLQQEHIYMMYYGRKSM